MRLEDMEKAAGLQRQREWFVRLSKAAASGRLGDLNVYDEGRIDVFGMIPADFIRQAIIEGCREALVKIDAELRSIGVRVANPYEEPEGDAKTWRMTAEMYARAWTRELGGSLINKRHHIDALCLTTRELREKATANQQGGSNDAS